jgi:uncharacterized protein (DUF2461 family)
VGVEFSGWPAEAVEFFKGLQADNTKAYWTAHKALYEASVREPMAELLGELSEEFGSGRISRPYRDVRFRAYKSPYKTEIYATLDRGGYVRFSVDGLTAALGYFRMTTTQPMMSCCSRNSSVWLPSATVSAVAVRRPASICRQASSVAASMIRAPVKLLDLRHPRPRADRPGQADRRGIASGALEVCPDEPPLLLDASLARRQNA